MTAAKNDFMNLESEGIMSFLTELNASKPLQYGLIKDQEVIYQQGKFVE